MSIKALSDYTIYSRYAQYLPEEKRRETWVEAVSRPFAMHRIKYAKQIEEYPELAELINFAEEQQKKKRVLSSQRSLQFAIEPILKHELKMFNCLFTHIDRERVFQEMMYSLLCGCGVGFSVQTQHIKKLGGIQKPKDITKTFVIEDSIEGWADAIGVLMSSYFINILGTFKNADIYGGKFVDYRGYSVEFDYSQIRPEGSLIAGRYKAPGASGLRTTIEKIRSLLNRRIESDDFLVDSFANKLRPIDAYDIVMHISDAVLSGGVRRSATLCLFSKEDDKMLNAKIGDWHSKNPQRARSNNSVALLRGHVSKEEFNRIMQSTKQFGEPGFIWTDDLESGYNPCVEINLYPKTKDGRSGYQACNLTEINGRYCDTEEKFLEACKASAIMGTLQAGYTNLKYLTPASKEIFEQEALLGCSITGMMDNPDILFNPEIQKKGAELILKVNEEVAKMLGIRPAARATCIKPAGSTSCVLGTASGIHPHHAKRYIRRTQVNRSEFCGQIFADQNPSAVEKSVWSANGTDKVISFLCEVPSGAIVKNQLSAIDLLNKVKLTQQNWVEYGTKSERCMNPKLRHNVSNTITVKDEEWDEVEKYIFDNQQYFAGISLLAASGDLDYAQAPFSTVLTPSELVKEYGDASVFASGLIVDGLHAFDNNLWAACDTVLGVGEVLERDLKKPEQPKEEIDKESNSKEIPMVWLNFFQDTEKYYTWFKKTDWERRVKQFAGRYFENDIRRATYCLKHVSLWKTWCDLKREYVEIDWTNLIEENEVFIDANTLGATACAGGACVLEI